MLCPACNAECREGARFCDACGSALTLRCASCQAELRAEARFCDACGQAVVASAAAPEPATAAPRGVPSLASLPSSFADGRYSVKSFLGEGGRKRVYLAHDTTLDRDVALAVIKTEGLDNAGLSRVKREAQAMARLGDHPNIVTIHDIGEENGQPFIVSQYMAGGDLDGVLNRAPDRRLPIAEAIQVAQQVVQGLAHAHSRGIIHRDLKPGNIWLTDDGTPKIGDFGLAVSLDRSRLTMEGMMVGTVAYMAPEQALGRQPDARSDLYSLGCVTYEMVTGRPPFLGDDPVAIISQHINTAPVAPSWHNPEVPKALEALIMRALAKDPDERPESAAAIPAAFQAIVDSSSTTAPVAAEADANPLDRLAGGIFVGRDKEMDELRAGLEDALSGRGRLMMLVGEPGIGKTRTSEEFATYARLRGAQVVWGRCYEGEGAPAYWPWVQAIRSYVHEREPQQLMSEMGPGAADIAQVVSEVKERLPGLPVPPQLEPEQARFRLFDSITTFLKNASNQKPTVLVLDDLHWGDKPSLLLLQFLARELRGARLLVLGTYRDVELRRDHPLSQTLGELGREGLSHRITLRGLSENDVARFVEITSGNKPPDALVEAVYRETEGNPFFVNEVVRLLVADGRLDKPESVTSWSVTIPQGVREVVGRRLDHLSDECNRVLTIGAVIGREFDLKTVEKVLSQAEEGRMTGDRLIEVLEEAVAARVINEVPNRLDWYSFAHALIRETLYEELSTARRVRLHRQIGEVLESDVDAHLPQLAYHFCEAAPGGDVEKAVDYARNAGGRAEALFAYEEAAAHYERALQVLEVMDRSDERVRCELGFFLGSAQRKVGLFEPAATTLSNAFDLAQTLKDPDLMARSALEFQELAAQGSLMGHGAAVPMLRSALEAIGGEDSELRGRLLCALSGDLIITFPTWDWHRDERRALAREAMAIGERLGDPGLQAYALSRLLWASDEPALVHDRLDMARRMITLAEQAKGAVLELAARAGLIADSLMIGDMATVDEEIERADQLAEQIRERYYEGWTLIRRAMRAGMKGDYVTAERYALELIALSQRLGTGIYAQTGLVHLFNIRVEQGRAGELEPAVKGTWEQSKDNMGWLGGLAYTYALLGRRAEAQQYYDMLAEDDFERVPEDFNYLVVIAVAAWLVRYLDDEHGAGVLYEKLLPYNGLTITINNGGACIGAASGVLGLLAATLGRFDDAETHFKDALALNERIGARPWVARVQLNYAEMLMERNAEGDRRRALELLQPALSTFEELGMKQWIEPALTLKLSAQGVDLSSPANSIDTVAREAIAEHPDLKPHAAPDGTVTIMFSDIEGSTAMADRLGDAPFMAVLREHNAIIRDGIKAHGGYEVKSEGDGFMVAFQSARAAIECAVAIQEALAERNETAAEPVQVRIGLHTGEVIKEGEDFFGRNVILAARVASQAHGGQVLVSDVVKSLLEGSGITWAEPRTVELKGLSGTHQVWPLAL